MSDADINWLLSDERSVIRHFPKGAFIFKELDRPGQVYVLLDGKVVIAKGTLSGKRILITRIEQSGEMFGEVYAFLGKACYPMYAEAAEDTSVLIVDNDIFFGEDGGQPRAAQKMRNNLLTVFANKAYRMNQKLRVLGGGGIREKIACFLVEQQDKEGRINGSFSREEMADYLNVARPSLSRELGKMQQEGISSLERRQIQIKDTGRHLTNAFDFLCRVFGEGQELVIFLSELSAGYYSLQYVTECGNEAYYKYNRMLLLKDRGNELKEEVMQLLSL